MKQRSLRQKGRGNGNSDDNETTTKPRIYQAMLELLLRLRLYLLLRKPELPVLGAQWLPGRRLLLHLWLLPRLLVVMLAVPLPKKSLNLMSC